MENKTHKLSELREDLINLGLKSDDRILIHSSLRSVGKIEGRAEGLIALLMEYLHEGAILMPAHTWMSVNKNNPRFIHAETPSGVGALTEVFRNTPGVIRSAHPTHSNCGWGVDIDDLLRDQEKFNTPCGPKSTYARLDEKNYKILLVGVNFSRNTAIHALEERAKVPGRLSPETEALEVEFADGRVISSPQHRHIGPTSENYVRIEPMLKAMGILKEGKLGNAKVLHMETKPLFETVTNLLRKDPEYFTRNSID